MKVSEIWDLTQKLNSEMFRNIENGMTHDEARKIKNAKIAEACTPEEYTISELCRCDINVDLALIVYEVKDVFPDIRGPQISGWAIANAEKHHEIYVPKAWIQYDKVSIPD